MFKKTKLEIGKKDCLTVGDLSEALKDCRPDAQIYTAYSETSNNIYKVRKIINNGNNVTLAENI